MSTPATTTRPMRITSAPCAPTPAGAGAAPARQRRDAPRALQPGRRAIPSAHVAAARTTRRRRHIWSLPRSPAGQCGPGTGRHQRGAEAQSDERRADAGLRAPGEHLYGGQAGRARTWRSTTRRPCTSSAPDAGDSSALALALAAHGKYTEAQQYQAEAIFEAVRNGDKQSAESYKATQANFVAKQVPDRPWPAGHAYYNPPLLTPIKAASLPRHRQRNSQKSAPRMPLSTFAIRDDRMAVNRWMAASASLADRGGATHWRTLPLHTLRNFVTIPAWRGAAATLGAVVARTAARGSAGCGLEVSRRASARAPSADCTTASKKSCSARCQRRHCVQCKSHSTNC